MTPSRMRDVGLEVQKASIAVAYVAQAHGAEIVSLGTIGTRPCDLDQRMRPLHSQATHRVFVSEAGPGGSGLSPDLTKPGPDG